MPYLDLDHIANNSFIHKYAEYLLFVCILSFPSHNLFKFRSPGTAVFLFPLKITAKSVLKVSKKTLYYLYIEAFVAFERSVK